jgi:hypothetical protein
MNQKSINTRVFACVLSGLLCAGSFSLQQLRAQITTATIAGTVTDSSGAAITDTQVVIRNTGTGGARTVKSDAAGRYIVADLAVGEYEAEASKAGFSTELRKGITLTVGGQVAVDFTLPVGQQAATVTVQGEVSQVETSSATIANLVEQKQIQELPLNGRNFQQLITLAPGVSVAQNLTSTLFGTGNTYSIAGGRAEGMAMVLDGTDIMDFYNKGTGAAVLGTSLGIDAIAEFQTVTNTYGAQFAGQGAVINAVSKSGTNAFHGTAFEFLRNSDVDARNFFDGASPPPFRRNQFGGALGGPIKKDKAFFFFNYEGLRQNLGLTEIAQAPDANLRNGTYQGKKYPITPFIQSLLDLYPATTLVSSTGVVKVPQVANQVSDENYYLARFDYAFSDKDSLFVRVVSDKGTLSNPFSGGAVPLWPDFEQSPNLFVTAEERRIVSPTLVNVARASFVRTDSDAVTTQTTPPLQWVPGNVGFAFDPFKDHKTSIRGGFGVFHDPILPRVYVGCLATHQPAVAVQVNNAPFPYPFVNAASPPVPSDTVCYDYQTGVAPYLMEWNFSVQREIVQGTILTVAYVGSEGVHLFVERDLNPPLATIDASGVYHFGATRINPAFGLLDNFVAGGTSHYNSLQANLTHRFAHNFQAQVVYTWAHSIDDGSGTYGTELGGPAENPYNIGYDRGLSTFDVRQSATINGVYAFPFKGNKFVEGWQLSGIFTAHTGTPFSPVVGYDISALGNNQVVERPNINPGFNSSNIITGNPNQWFNPAAFSLPAPGTIGNAGRDILRNPGLVDTDVSIVKDTRIPKISEQFGVQFRVELFNIFNHPNFAPFGLTGNNGVFTASGVSPTAGLITATSTTSRQIQFSLRVRF